MKCLCFFIYFIFLNVSINASLESYKKEIFKTNNLFEDAINMNNCIVRDKLIANGLVHVIKKFVLEDKHSLDIMNHMLVTPECSFCRPMWLIGDNNIQRNQTFPQSRYTEDSILFHQTLQKEIMNELEITAAVNSNSDFKVLTFEELGAARRNLTGRALRHIVRQIIDLEELFIDELGRARGSLTGALLNIVREIIGGHTSESKFDLRKKCEFIALFLSTKNPIMSLEIRTDNGFRSCTIDKFNNYSVEIPLPQTLVYREIEGVWWQVKRCNLNERIRLLKEEL